MSVTITLKEYNALIAKGKSGWKMYYTLLEDELQVDADTVKHLSQLLELVDDQCQETLNSVNALLDGYKLRITCVICLEDTLNKTNAQILPCLHRFHKECISNYRAHTKNYKCPECRQ